MSAPLVYEADRDAFLAIQRRAAEHLARIRSDAGIDVEEWTRGWKAIATGVDEIPFVAGVRYRIRVLAGDVQVEHLHLEDEKGQVHGIDLPVSRNPEFRELEGVFRGRHRAGGASTLLFSVAGQLAMLGDIDILRAEEVRA